MRKLHQGVLVLAAGALFTLASAQGALADSGSGTLPVGGNICVGPFFSDGTSIELDGQVTNNVIANPKWTISQSPDNTTYTVVFKDHAFAITADIRRTDHPTLFPGYFLSCLKNDQTVSVDFTISIGPGQF